MQLHLTLVDLPPGLKSRAVMTYAKTCDLLVQLLLTKEQDLFLRNISHEPRNTLLNGSLVQIENLHHDMTNKSRLLNL